MNTMPNNYDSMKVMTVYARDWELERNVPTHLYPDWVTVRDAAVHRAFVTLEMRYQTYARDSWTALVLLSVERTKSCSCETCEVWRMREVQIINEVRIEMSRAYQQLKEKESYEPTK